MLILLDEILQGEFVLLTEIKGLFWIWNLNAAKMIPKTRKKKEISC
jgi:hypothetical protein